MIATVKEYDFTLVDTEVAHLINSFENQDNKVAVKKMKAWVPEFKSNNSIFEELD
jgi:hypothetical protein